MIAEPTYLGDGVYLKPGRYPGELILTTGDHREEHADAIVYLEPAVVEALARSIQK